MYICCLFYYHADEFVSLPQYLPIISNPGVTPDVSFTRQFLFSSSKSQYFDNNYYTHYET
jgi:hypothetical protein